MIKKQVTCSSCFGIVQIKGSSIIDGVRICHKCKAEKDELQYRKFAEGLKK